MTETLFTARDRCPLCDERAYTAIRHEPVNIAPFTEEEAQFFRPYLNAGPIEFRQCSRCTFCYLDRIPSDPKYFDVLYSRVKYDWNYELRYDGKKNIFRHMRRHLLRHVPAGSTLLDIGTWCGTLLRALQDTYKVSGCELSREAAAAGQAAGFDIRVGFVETMTFDREFDIVTMIDVLEHLPDPRAMIQTVFSLLPPGGVFYIKVPNGTAQIRKENLLSALGRQHAGASFGFVHLNHFNTRSLSRALEAAGFQMLETGYAKIENWDLSEPTSASVRARRFAHNVAVNAIVGTAGLLRRLRVADIGPHLYVMARKPQRG